MRGPRNSVGRQKAAEREAKRTSLSVKSYRDMPDAELVARRGEVYLLLAWYHRTVVKPNMGLRGFLRRLWTRLVTKKTYGVPWRYLELVDPFGARDLHEDLMEYLSQTRDPEAAEPAGPEAPTDG